MIRLLLDYHRSLIKLSTEIYRLVISGCFTRAKIAKSVCVCVCVCVLGGRGIPFPKFVGIIKYRDGVYFHTYTRTSIHLRL